MSPRYTAMVRRYWTRYRPLATSRLPDPETFFGALGTQIATAVTALSAQMQGSDWPGETHLEKIGRVNAIRRQAEEQVLAELLYSAAPELSPIEELEELLAQLPSSEMIMDALTQIDVDAQAQADLEDAGTVLLSVEQIAQKRELEMLLPLVSVADLDALTPQEVAARVQALRPFWTRQQV